MKFPFPATIKGLKTTRKTKIEQNLQETQKEERKGHFQMVGARQTQGSSDSWEIKSAQYNCSSLLPGVLKICNRTEFRQSLMVYLS